MRRTRLGVGVVGSVLLSAGGARAEAGTGEGVRVEYAAPEGCPSRESFIAEVGARTARLRMAGEGEAGRTFRVTLAAAGDGGVGGFEGTLVVEEAGEGGGRSEKIGRASCR